MAWKFWIPDRNSEVASRRCWKWNIYKECRVFFFFNKKRGFSWAEMSLLSQLDSPEYGRVYECQRQSQVQGKTSTTDANTVWSPSSFRKNVPKDTQNYWKIKNHYHHGQRETVFVTDLLQQGKQNCELQSKQPTKDCPGWRTFARIQGFPGFPSTFQRLTNVTSVKPNYSRLEMWDSGLGWTGPIKSAHISFTFGDDDDHRWNLSLWKHMARKPTPRETPQWPFLLKCCTLQSSRGSLLVWCHGDGVLTCFWFLLLQLTETKGIEKTWQLWTACQNKQQRVSLKGFWCDWNLWEETEAACAWNRLMGTTDVFLCSSKSAFWLSLPQLPRRGRIYGHASLNSTQICSRAA